MKIFVSHAISDKKLIQQIKLTLEPHGIMLLIAEHHLDLRNTVTKKIEKMIDSCDVALVLLTKSGFNSTFVQQEIGYIHRARKPLLQVIQKNLESKIAGFNFGRGFIALNPAKPDIAIGHVRTSILKYWKKTEEEKARQLQKEKRQIDEQRRQTANVIGIAVGIILLIALLGTSE